jgi:hypothetical protein
LIRVGVKLAYGALVISFGGLVSLGTTYAFGLSIGGSTIDPTSTVIVGAICVISFLGTYEPILRVMNMEEYHYGPSEAEGSKSHYVRESSLGLDKKRIGVIAAIIIFIVTVGS